MRSATIKIIIWVVATFIIVALLGGGILEGPSQAVYNFRMQHFPNFNFRIDDYIIYIPLVIWLILLICGTKGATNNRWGVVLKGVLAFALMWIIVGSLKGIIGEVRPDASNMYSFPSGHTASAFAASTILYKEYGYRITWSWVVIYIPAVVVGCLRMLNNKHWLNDVLAGALIGITCVLLIYYFALFIHSSKNKNDTSVIQE